jgi:sortase B
MYAGGKVNRTIIYALILLLPAIAAACGILFFHELRSAREEIAEYAAIQEQFTTLFNPAIEPAYEAAIEPDDPIPPEWAGLPYLAVDFEALLSINPDTVGWVAIPHTPVSYPVVQTTNNHKYLATSFNGGHSRAGTVFADSNNDMRNLDTVTIIYGHNMGTGRDDMFSSLLGYKEYGYHLENRFIQFDTVYQRYGWWEIFAVIELDIRATEFPFLQLSFGSAADFMDWVAKAKELSIHDIEMDIDPNDRILMLSTCDRSNFGHNGRLLILAVNIQETNHFQNEQEGLG